MMRPVSDYSLRECADMILRNLDVQGITTPVRQASVRLATWFVEASESVDNLDLHVGPSEEPRLSSEFIAAADIEAETPIAAGSAFFSDESGRVIELCKRVRQQTGHIATLTAERDQARQQVSSLADAMHELLAEQNGVPLLRREPQYRAAITKAWEELAKAGRCSPNNSDPACPDCGAVDCERAFSSINKCSSGFLPGAAKVCERCGRLNCEHAAIAAKGGESNGS